LNLQRRVEALRRKARRRAGFPFFQSPIDAAPPH
jgi:hypothetical protein